ncbi:DNA translocase FtsK [bacterium]|nr:DNA translocase FtsK [bacterium]
MAKRTVKRQKLDEEERLRSISSDALRGVAAVFSLAIAGFLVLADFQGGGSFGVLVYAGVSYLLGVGYLLLPISLVLLAIALIRTFERHFGWVQALCMLLFLLTSLGLVEIALPGQGGLLGYLISSTLVPFVDTAATVIFLVSFIIASLIISFDTHIGHLFGRLYTMLFPVREEEEFGKRDVEEATVNVPLGETEPEENAESVPPPQEDEVGEEPLPKEKKARITMNDSEESAGFPIFAASAGEYEAPPVSLLSKNKGKPEVGDVKGNMNIIKRTLQNFGITVEMDEASIGPTVTRYSMKPAEGVRLAKIVALQSNLELALAASPVRIEAPIPGKSLVGIEVPNIARTTLGLAPIFTDPQFTQSEKPLLIALGRSITGTPHFADLAKMPHMLVAGATGAGKSVTIHDFIVSLLYRCGPDKLRFIMVDPKRVELTLYNAIPHLLTPVITDAKKAILALKWLAKEMDRRYGILETEKVRDIGSYHANIVKPALDTATGEEGEKLPEAMPYIVVIIDELADIMQAYPRELEAGIVRLAQMSRAVGIHLVLSTQRPSVKVITGLIKANVPARVALQVSSQIDSRTILDMSGAEKLLGAGDMLFLSGDMSKPVRIQAPYISESEVKRVAAHLAKLAEGQLPSEINFEEAGKVGSGTDAIFSSIVDDDEEDELYGEARAAVLEAGKASTSYLQRKLKVGYSRAARLIDILEDRGVIGPGDGAKPREVIGAGNADELAQESSETDSETESEEIAKT